MTPITRTTPTTATARRGAALRAEGTMTAYLRDLTANAHRNPAAARSRDRSSACAAQREIAGRDARPVSFG